MPPSAVGEPRLDRLCIELRPATVRSYPTGQVTLDGREIMESYSENPSRARRVAAVREAMREAEQLAIQVADLDELELALESLWSAIPAITVEKHDNAA